jgi:hypothetical protein
MTWFASSLVMTGGLGAVEGARGSLSLMAPRQLRKLTDVHGREG